MKILTYNINGIRSALSKGLIDFLKREDADVVCFQELKAQEDQIDIALFEALGYHCFWFPAVKKGYSGVGILSKTMPKHVEKGCGHELFDFEGRIIRADFDTCSVMSVYFPSGSSGDHRQDLKFEFLEFFSEYIQKIKDMYPQLVICGDYNICHEAIDIHDPIGNKNSSGFLPEERAWMDVFFNNGFVDTFRYLHPGMLHQYTWWSFRAGARGKNKGWRIDYISVCESMKTQISDSGILPEDVHSDHCASWVGLDL